MRTDIPTRAIMGVEGLPMLKARALAFDAAKRAKRYAPKLTVASSSRFMPIWGDGWFGVAWEHPYIWFQEAGTRPFTMRSLAGKTVPMWVDDPQGELMRKNPKAKTRVTTSGRRQTLIFRRAATPGQRKMRWRRVGSSMVRESVPASYPGAPGRIAVNRSQGIMRVGDVDRGAQNPGQIAANNVGVRWRHPGVRQGKFFARALSEAAQAFGVLVNDVQYLNRLDAMPQEQRSILVHSV